MASFNQIAGSRLPQLHKVNLHRRKKSWRRPIPQLMLFVIVFITFSFILTAFILRTLNHSISEVQDWFASRVGPYRLSNLRMVRGFRVPGVDIFQRTSLPLAAFSTRKSEPGNPFRSNGLLEFDMSPNQSHPIPQLIQRAKKAWDAKVSSQSTTVSQAATTYRNRYQRNPPLGYDRWFTWAREHGVQLLDEYDQIMSDFLPLEAIEPSDLRHRNAVVQFERTNTFVLAIDLVNKKVHTAGEWHWIRRATDIKGFLDRFVHLLPGSQSGWLNMSFIVDDQPGVLVSHEHYERLVELANAGSSE